MLVQNESDSFNLIMPQNGTAMAFKHESDEIEPHSANEKPLDATKQKDKQKNIYQEIRELWRLSRGPELPGKYKISA